MREFFDSSAKNKPPFPFFSSSFRRLLIFHISVSFPLLSLSPPLIFRPLSCSLISNSSKITDAICFTSIFLSVTKASQDQNEYKGRNLMTCKHNHASTWRIRRWRKEEIWGLQTSCHFALQHQLPSFLPAGINGSHNSMAVDVPMTRKGAVGVGEGVAALETKQEDLRELERESVGPDCWGKRRPLNTSFVFSRVDD